MITALGGMTRVLRAGIIIVTGPFIKVTIAVVVFTITAFGGRIRRIAQRESKGAANTFTFASAPLAGGFARGPQLEVNCLLRTGADACLIDTLGRQESIHGCDLVAREAEGTGLLIRTRAAAKITIRSILYADIIDSSDAFTVCSRDTRLA